jgi:hypothetical protein
MHVSTSHPACSIHAAHTEWTKHILRRPPVEVLPTVTMRDEVVGVPVDCFTLQLQEPKCNGVRIPTFIYLARYSN